MKNRRTDRQIEKANEKEENVKSAHREVFMACGESADVPV